MHKKDADVSPRLTLIHYFWGQVERLSGISERNSCRCSSEVQYGKSIGWGDGARAVSATPTMVGISLGDVTLEQSYDETLRHTFKQVRVINGYIKWCRILKLRKIQPNCCTSMYLMYFKCTISKVWNMERGSSCGSQKEIARTGCKFKKCGPIHPVLKIQGCQVAREFFMCFHLYPFALTS